MAGEGIGTSGYDPRYGADLERVNRPGQAGQLDRRSSLNPPPPNRLNVPGALNTIDEQLDILIHKTISEFENHLQLVLGSPTPSSAEVAKAHDSQQIVDRMMR